MLLRQHLSLVVGSVVPETHNHIPETSYDSYSHQPCTVTMYHDATLIYYASNFGVNVNSI